MQVDITKKLFTVEEYHRMGEAGILSPHDRLELIEGEIIEMSPIGQRHMACVDRATHFISRKLDGKALVSVQNPLRLSNLSEPQPDIVVLKLRPDFYASKPHTPEDTFFVLEVSDTTLRYDSKVKLPLYAATGVVELWIENLQEDVLLICRDPQGREYKTQMRLQRGDSVAPLAFPDVTFQVGDLLG
jgi:Uma2 family endonuclease